MLDTGLESGEILREELSTSQHVSPTQMQGSCSEIVAKGTGKGNNIEAEEKDSKKENRGSSLVTLIGFRFR
jgi:hypothetical protein